MNNLFFLLMIASYAGGCLTAMTGGRGKLARSLNAAFAIFGAGSGIALGSSVLLTGIPFSATLLDLFPLGGGLKLSLDPLGSFFLILIGLGAVPASIYGIGYTEPLEKEGISMRLFGLMYNLFLLSMSLVSMAANVMTFLIMWEGMSLTSYFLVITENHEASSIRAGNWYAAMTHAGLALLLAAFVIMSNGGSGSFVDIRNHAASLPSNIRNIIFILAFLGFGSKAGIVPLHVWLPKAHPAAPGHISALMSGVMIKFGLYGLLRVVLDLLGGGPAWWGSMILIFGVLSALLGILYALMEHDLKRLLAYSSVENVGIILMGAGAGLIFYSYGLMELAAFAIIACLYHTLNHACFKGLVFMGAGSILHSTHMRSMEKLGGLIKAMPWTAVFFLIGSAAISALPPLNGFVSEWMIFQSLLAGFSIPKPELAILMPLAVGLLALTSGLAAACFVKAFGISFLALPRSAEAQNAQESPLSMIIGMGILAILCLILSVAPVVIIPILGKAIAGLGKFPTTIPGFSFSLAIQTPNAFGEISPALIALGVILIFGLILFAVRIAHINHHSRTSETWGCGRTGQTSRMEYTATAFAEPLRRIFAEVYRPTKELSIDFHPDSKYFVESIEYKSGITPLFDRWIYDPIIKSIRFISSLIQRLQAGSLHLYLLYIAAFLVILLLIARWL